MFKLEPERLYNRRLAQALEELGMSWYDLPTNIRNAPWHEQRWYFELNPRLGYCTDCKLPKPITQMSTLVGSRCDPCGQRFRADQADRRARGIQHRYNSTPRNRARYARSREAKLQRQQLREYANARMAPSTEPILPSQMDSQKLLGVDASNPESPSELRARILASMAKPTPGADPFSIVSRPKREPSDKQS